MSPSTFPPHFYAESLSCPLHHSRLFRNRFVELHFDQIPADELQIILHKRFAMPPSYCQRLVAVMQELQFRRRGSTAFAGKQGFMTLRDLFRYAP